VRKPSRDRRGATLIEMAVTLGIFSLLSLLLAVSFTKAHELWSRTSGGSDAQQNLRKLRNRLSRDLNKTSFASVGTSLSLSSLGPADGSAIWFLSPVNQATGEFVRTSTGTPSWQHHILYYAVVPNNHIGFVGFSCTGGADSEGFDIHCPHKIVLRKVIDIGDLADPNDESTVEIPFADVDPPVDVSKYLTRPKGLDTSAMLLEDGVLEVSIVSTNILSFNVSVAKDASQPREIEIETASVSIPTAQKELRIGQEPLKGTVHESRVTVRAHPRMP
jgi:Tfp pilus assembly protein PilE